MVQDDPAPAADPQDDPPARKPVTAPKPVAKASSEPKKPAEEPKPEEPKPADPPADEPAATTPEPKPEMKAEPPADAPPADDSEPGDEEMAADALAADALEADAPAMTAPPAPEPPAADEPAVGDEAPPEPTRAPPPEFQPLDADRMESLRAELLRAKVTAELERRTTAAADFMYTLGSEVWANVPDPRDPATTQSEEEIEALRDAARAETAKRLKAFAAENGFGYSATPFLAPADLGSEQYPVTRAEARAASPTARPELAIGPFFANLEGPLYQVVRTGVAPDTGDHFAAWKIDQRYSAEQALTDEGVRDAVVAAFKRQKAAELAEARAEALAAKASESGVSLRKAVEGETVTGKPDGEPLEVSETGPFTRLRLERPTGQLAFFQPPTPRPNPVPTIGSASPDFLEAAFDTLTPGAATAVPAFDPDRSFTIELLAREPSDAALSEMYESFLKDAATNPGLYNSAGDEVAGAAQRAFVEGLFEKYGVDPAGLSGILER